MRTADVMQTLALPVAEWEASTRRLVQAGLVRREGRARGTRYTITAAGVAAITRDA